MLEKEQSLHKFWEYLLLSPNASATTRTMATARYAHGWTRLHAVGLSGCQMGRCSEVFQGTTAALLCLCPQPDGDTSPQREYAGYPRSTRNRPLFPCCVPGSEPHQVQGLTEKNPRQHSPQCAPPDR